MEQKNLILGFDFGKSYSEICRYDRGTRTAVTLPAASGQGQFPTVLAKKTGENVWKSGWDAEEFARQQNGAVIRNVYEICLREEKYAVSGREFTPGEILAEFLRDSLKKVGVECPELQISAIMITTGRLTKPLVENVRQAYRILGLPKGRAYLQDHDESFYFHVLFQKPEFWSRKVGLISFDHNEVSFSSLSVSTKTRPASCTVKKGPSGTLSERPRERDREFSHFLENAIGTEIYSSIFLTGEQFDLSFADTSLKVLKKNQRRVFGGTNLFAGGAAFAAREKVEDRLLKGYLFLGNDLVRYNIGMEMTISGSPAYYPLIVAGVNWYEAEKECEFLLDETDELVFLVSSMEDGKRKRYTMKLSGLPSRPPRTTRIHLRIEYDSPSTCRITAEDLGFGEFFPATHQIWKETFGEVEK